MKIITAQEMARMDRESPVSVEVLMERAGQGLADFIDQSLPRYPVCFICGSGNNGGDGFVAARYLHNRGREVEVFLVGKKSKLKELPRHQAVKMDLEIHEIDDSDIISRALNRKKIVVDCILGTGFNPPLKPECRHILEIINKKSKITLSCDIPTGVNGDTGEADPSSVNADVTVTFEYPKVGHVNSPGSEFTGSIEIVNIDIGLSPEKYIEDKEFTVSQDCLEYFARRSKDTHKKNYGHILVIGGSPGMEGAPAMAVLGALKSGAGLVTCAVAESIASTVAGYSMSAMTLPLEVSSSGCLCAASAGKILEFIKSRKVDCVVLGPGISTHEDSRELTRQLTAKIEVPMVLDADGINNLCGAEHILRECKYPTLITPHPREMSRLAGISIDQILNDRHNRVREISRDLNCAVVLKGYRTLISDGNLVYVNSSGNPGMATGGTGDVLAGIAGSLIGQGLELVKAARTAAWVHGRAGDIAAWEYGQRYILPENILSSLGKI